MEVPEPKVPVEVEDTDCGVEPKKEVAGVVAVEGAAAPKENGVDVAWAGCCPKAPKAEVPVVGLEKPKGEGVVVAEPKRPVPWVLGAAVVELGWVEVDADPNPGGP